MTKSLFCGALILFCRAGQVTSQTDEFANRLVVMIKTVSSQGAGIICGADARGIYIATADHVVRPGTTPARISVRSTASVCPSRSGSIRKKRYPS